MGDGRVVEIAEVLAFDGATEIDGRGYMVLRALVLAHMHLDKTLLETSDGAKGPILLRAALRYARRQYILGGRHGIIGIQDGAGHRRL